MFILGQIFGIISLIVYCLGVQIKEKKGVLKIQASSNMFIALQYLCLEAYTGAGTFIISAIRSYSFYKYEEKHSKRSILLLIIFLVVSLFLGIKTYQNIYSLLPIIVALLTTVIMWQKNEFIARAGIVIVTSVLIIYNIQTKSYSGILTYIVMIVSTIISIVRNDIKKIEV